MYAKALIVGEKLVVCTDCFFLLGSKDLGFMYLES